MKIQLMAEDEEVEQTDTLESDPHTTAGGKKLARSDIAALDDSDIRTNVYEGGFKTWECAIDFVRYLSENSCGDIATWKSSESDRPRRLIEVCSHSVSYILLFFLFSSWCD